jgi:ribonuclease BN (tRNA processing enzyme)
MILIQVNHSVPTVGVWAEQEADQYRFAFTGDCFTNDNFWKRLNELPEVHDLIADCQYTEDQSALAKIARHYYPTALAEDLKKLLYTPRLILSHLPAGERDKVLSEAKEKITNYSISEASSL